MSHRSRFVVALVMLVLLAIAASRQFFLISHVTDPLSSGLPGYHLWLAVSSAMGACIAGGLMFHFFVRHERDKWSKVAMTPTGPPLIDVVRLATKISPAPARLDPISWALANPWLVEGQADDRTPMDGSVAESGGTASEQRSFARRSHQLRFKKWSQGRHD